MRELINGFNDLVDANIAVLEKALTTYDMCIRSSSNDNGCDDNNDMRKRLLNQCMSTIRNAIATYKNELSSAKSVSPSAKDNRIGNGSISSISSIQQQLQSPHRQQPPQQQYQQPQQQQRQQSHQYNLCQSIDIINNSETKFNNNTNYHKSHVDYLNRIAISLSRPKTPSPIKTATHTNVLPTSQQKQLSLYDNINYVKELLLEQRLSSKLLIENSISKYDARNDHKNGSKRVDITPCSSPPIVVTKSTKKTPQSYDKNYNNDNQYNREPDAVDSSPTYHSTYDENDFENQSNDSYNSSKSELNMDVFCASNGEPIFSIGNEGKLEDYWISDGAHLTDSTMNGLNTDSLSSLLASTNSFQPPPIVPTKNVDRINIRDNLKPVTPVKAKTVTIRGGGGGSGVRGIGGGSSNNNSSSDGVGVSSVPSVTGMSKPAAIVKHDAVGDLNSYQNGYELSP